MRVAAAGTESTQALVSMSRFSASGMVDEAFGGDQATEELFVATKDISALDGFDLSIILGHPGVYIGKILDEREGFTNDIHYRSLQSGKSRIHVSESSRISTSKTWQILLSP
jgi:hypothetical protein